MASFQITKVRTERAYGASHDHISAVELGNRTDWRFNRDYIVGQIRSPSGDRYYTFANGSRADVVVVGCPHCTFRDYIKTTADGTTADNLLSLPRF
jgi:hypothetical protein